MTTELTADLTVTTYSEIPPNLAHNTAREIAAVVAVGRLIRIYPDVRFETMRLAFESPEDDPREWVAAYGVRPECPSCHCRHGEVHTEYCHTLKHQTDAGRALCGTCTPRAENHDYPGQPGLRARDEERPADDPTPVVECNGANCGGYPHS